MALNGPREMGGHRQAARQFCALVAESQNCRAIGANFFRQIVVATAFFEVLVVALELRSRLVVSLALLRSSLTFAKDAASFLSAHDLENVLLVRFGI